MLCELCKEFVMYIVDISSTCRKDKFKIKTDITYKILNFHKNELKAKFCNVNQSKCTVYCQEKIFLKAGGSPVLTKNLQSSTLI